VLGYAHRSIPSQDKNEPGSNPLLEDIMKNTLFDTESVTKTALFGGVEGWYDAFWLGERPGAGRHRINKVNKIVGSLRDMIDAIRVVYPVLRVRMRKVLALTGAAVVPFDFPMQNRRLQTKTK
jgi:hypothetical protein